MTAKGRGGGRMEQEAGPSTDKFPVGMRILAVDDDPACLKFLEALLLLCDYQVTTTSQAVHALNILRANRDGFDLVISDVHMPDMDGFKLLEQVGLEMDLPVIMLSGNDDTEAVMKGITHGACDYLLKPVRIEELKNIWQHVVRKKTFKAKDGNNLGNEENCEKDEAENGTQVQVKSIPPKGHWKHNKKRKDQIEENEIVPEENTHESDDSYTQKKKRINWSPELHHQFVNAVNVLGVEAAPKKILDLMNVEGLTRENVASHLQKYRLCLKRLSAAAESRDAKTTAASRGRDPSFLRLGGSEAFRNVYPWMQIMDAPDLTAFQPKRVLNSMNNATGLGQLGPSGIVQHSHIQNNTNNNIDNLKKHQGVSLLGNQNGNLLMKMPMSLEGERVQQPKIVQETNNSFPGGFSRAGVAVGSSTNSYSNMVNNPLLLPANQQHPQSGVLGSHYSHLPDLGQRKDTQQRVVAEKHNQNHNPNFIFSSSQSQNLHMAGVVATNPMLNRGPPNQNMNMTMNSQNSGAPFLAQDRRTVFQVPNREESNLDSTKLQGGLSSSDIDDLVNAMTKPALLPLATRLFLNVCVLMPLESLYLKICMDIKHIETQVLIRYGLMMNNSTVEAEPGAHMGPYPMNYPFPSVT